MAKEIEGELSEDELGRKKAESISPLRRSRCQWRYIEPIWDL